MESNKLQDRFPDMQPVNSAPWLSTINGIGMTLYGRRDYDDETNTYIKTWCFCLLYLPIFALRAYRVADAESGWYFIGREPMSALTKAWNLLVVVAIVAGSSLGAWSHHTNSPAYIAGQRMAQAQQQSESGQLAEAARNYADVASGTTQHAQDAHDRLDDLIKVQIKQASAEQAAGVIDAVISLHGPEQVNKSYPELNAITLELARKHQKNNPRGALSLLDTIRGTHEPGEAEIELRESILVSIVETNPSDLEAVSELALIYESRGEDQLCIDLLAPHTDKLGDTEGARILGQIYAFRGDTEPAYKLLNAYTAARLERLHKAEQAYDAAVNNAWDQQIDLLNKGAAPDSFYEEYENADESGQAAILDTYVQERIKDDRSIGMALTELIEVSAVVPVALDLGMVMLNRASTMSDPDTKRAELEAAERTFLAIRGLAGETDEYRMYLGQVYYWLGKADQGKELLDQLLAAHNRSQEIMIAVASTLREVGAESEARALAEEAYRNAKDPETRYMAARMRSLMQLDRDDEIEWLKRSNPEDAGVQAALNSSLGARAADYGNPDAAMRYIRKAIEIYEDQPETASSLNNSALIYLRLFELDGDPATLKNALDRMDKAVNLMPSDSILMLNTTSAHLQATAYDVVNGKIDLVALKTAPSLDMLTYLYDNTQQKDVFSQEIVSHPSTTTAMGYADRLMLVAPQRSGSYAVPLLFHNFTRDTDKIRLLLDRVNNVQIDLTDTMSERLDYYSGNMDEKYQRENMGHMNKWRDVIGRIRGNTDPVTFAYAVGAYVHVSVAAWDVGADIDSNELVSLAEEAFNASASRGTRQTLRIVLCQRAVDQLSAADPAFARFAEPCKRSLDAHEIIALALAPGHRFFSMTSQHPDVQRVLAMIETFGQRYDNWNTWHWAMLRSTRPALAQQAASSVKTDETDRLTSKVTQALYGINAQYALADIWEAKIDGDREAVKAIIDRLLRNNIPVPPVSP